MPVFLLRWKFAFAIALVGAVAGCSSDLPPDDPNSTDPKPVSYELAALDPVEVMRGGATTVPLPRQLPASFRVEVRGLPPGLTAAADKTSISLRARDDARLAPFDATVAVLDGVGGVRSLVSWSVDVRLAPGQLDPDFATAGELVDVRPSERVETLFPRAILPFPSGTFLLLTEEYPSHLRRVTQRRESGAELAAFGIHAFIGIQAPLNRAVVRTYTSSTNLTKLAVLPEVGALDLSVFKAYPKPSKFSNLEIRETEHDARVGIDGTVYFVYSFHDPSDEKGAGDKVEIVAIDPYGNPKSTFGTNGRILFDAPARGTRQITLLALSDGGLLMHFGSQYPYRGFSPDPTQSFRKIGTTGVVDAKVTLDLSPPLYARSVVLDGSDRILVLGNREDTTGAAALVRATADGKLDVTFGDRGVALLPPLAGGADSTNANRRFIDTVPDRCALVPYSNGLIIGRWSEGSGECHFERVDTRGQSTPFPLSRPPISTRAQSEAVLVRGRRMLVFGTDRTTRNAIVQRYFL